MRAQIFIWLWKMCAMNDKAVLSLTLHHCSITSLWLDGRQPGVHASLFGTSMSDSGSQSQTLIAVDKLHEWWEVIFSDESKTASHLLKRAYAFVIVLLSSVVLYSLLMGSSKEICSWKFIDSSSGRPGQDCGDLVPITRIPGTKQKSTLDGTLLEVHFRAHRYVHLAAI